MGNPESGRRWTSCSDTPTSEHPHQIVWTEFYEAVYQHIGETKQGHYVRPGTIEPLEFMESYLSMDWIVGQVIKYACRVPITRNPKDLYKIAHYLSRIANIIEKTQKRS